LHRAGIPFFIAGATAREILLHHVHGRSIGRRTRDIDIAVFVDSWPRFDALKNAFFAEGAEAVRDNAHRMIVEGIELDIIPFGGVAEGIKLPAARARDHHGCGRICRGIFSYCNRTTR
jgi:predicted nucleotidyltransferase